MADNKVSEVEGLHRLLKLQHLDLSFNKLTTTKSLSQLAANYGSLQVFNSLGNPIMANVGVDATSKFVRGNSPEAVGPLCCCWPHSVCLLLWQASFHTLCGSMTSE